MPQGIGRGASLTCLLLLAALGHGAWHPRAAAPILAKGVPHQVLGHRFLLAPSEQGFRPKSSPVPKWARAIRGQATGWHCQPTCW